jgi:methionyl aminopeptidase
MTLAIEPMVAMGRAAVKVLKDGWTAVTKDHSLAAHFEHTVGITGAGPVILTTPGGNSRAAMPGGREQSTRG